MTTTYRVVNWEFDLQLFSNMLKVLIDPEDVKEYALIIGVDESTLRNWMNGTYQKLAFPFPAMHNFLAVCNHLDLSPVSFFKLEDKQQTAVEAVNELIEAEAIPAGYMIVSVAHFDSVVKQMREAQDMVRELEKQVVTRQELAYRCDMMRGVAENLAGAGGYDHKGKNEIILRCIGLLLQYSNPATQFTRDRDDDNIPF